MVRLTEEEIKAIKETAFEVFGNNVSVWLFGSRVKPELKGGDIDLYIELDEMKNWFEKKLEFLVKLKEKIGEQKIDVIVKPSGCKEFISIEAKTKGIKL